MRKFIGSKGGGGAPYDMDGHPSTDRPFQA